MHAVQPKTCDVYMYLCTYVTLFSISCVKCVHALLLLRNFYLSNLWVSLGYGDCLCFKIQLYTWHCNSYCHLTCVPSTCIGQLCMFKGCKSLIFLYILMCFTETTGDSALRAPDIPPASAAMSDSSDKQFKKVNNIIPVLFWRCRHDCNLLHLDHFEFAHIFLIKIYFSAFILSAFFCLAVLLLGFVDSCFFFLVQHTILCLLWCFLLYWCLWSSLSLMLLK